MEDVKEWLKNNGSGSGYGSGYGFGVGDCSGSGSGSGDGSGDGSGFGSGDGYGSGYGFGVGDCSGYGSGSGSGDGSGDGYGDGYGDGSGSGDGYGIGELDGKTVYLIDYVQTIITHIKDSTAKGFILENDFTLSPCFVVKGNGYFAHGKTLRKAMEALRAKIFENMDSEEAIEKFMEQFKKGERYAGTEFFEWHHYLTGSCLMGRESFVKSHGLSLDEKYTVDEFIDICENAYGGEIIRQLKERWNEL